MTTNEIRSKFLAFFKSKNHTIITSDSLVPKDDPTVLFTTAGMQQFKPQFLGRIDGYTRASTAQKCLRTDDLDCVGKTDFHHTFFEMLGNFSFGDYFKKDAITWAWEFLTQEMKLPKEKLWVSVYKEDEEAYQFWANEIKVPLERIVKLGDKSNFWPSNARLNGPNGPCGPCSEIFYDYGVNPKCPNGMKCDPDCSCGRFSEVWNLVFTQFNRKDGGVLEPLPAKNIDTGMGLERLAAVVQGKKSNYETDNFAAILGCIKDTFRQHNAHLSESEFRIVADHMRAITFGLSDGVVPSNEGRGYVMRKLIVDITDLGIRAGITKPVVFSFVDIVVERMKEPYPELLGKAAEIKNLVKRIEEAFIKIRQEKMPELKERLIKNRTNPQALGEIYFLYRDTHGLTISTITSVAAEAAVPLEASTEAMVIFEAKMEEQKNRSRASSKMMGDVFADQNFALNVPKTEFLGYSEIKAKAKVLKIFSEGEMVKVVLDRTPFYASSGGQVGDTGIISGPSGTMKVLDTQKTNDIFIHFGTFEKGNIKEGDVVEAVIDDERRKAITRNHTATHLLQAALREVLGSHVKQQGSLVDEARLRFDFSHPQGVKPGEIKRIEARLNDFVARSSIVTKEVLPIEEAKKKGALAFFAEKYGDVVRVISIGDYSTEFCGGTHVANTAEIEAVKLVGEGSVAQGIRRVEAITGRAEVSKYLKQIEEQALLKEQAAQQKLLEKQKQDQEFERIKSSVDDIIAKADKVGGVLVVSYVLNNADLGLLRKLSDVIKQKTKTAVLVLGTKNTNDAALVVSITDDVALKVKANEIVAAIAPMIGGSGGGRPNMAQAGGKLVEQLDQAMVKAKELVRARL